MCVNLLATAGMAGSMVETGGAYQAAGGFLNAVGDFASARTRASMNKADAAGEIAAGQARAKRIRTAGQQELSSARAAAAGSGVSVNSSSVMEAERQIVQNVEQDAGVAMLTGERRADSLNRSAKFYDMAGTNALLDGTFGAMNKWRNTRRPRGFFRPGDPYSDPGYFGGGEGE